MLQRWGRGIEGLLGDGPFVAGDAISVADLKLYMLVRWFAGGGVAHLPKDVFQGYPKLSGVHRAVAEHPAIVEWNERHA